ncbi:MAG: DUF1566 domain-containing protein [Thermodesulfobacteriota bacterium]
MAEPAEQKEIRAEGVIENYDAVRHTLELKYTEDHVRLLSLYKSSIVVAEARFIDNGDGTVTDMRRKIMWQQGDNGKEVTFQEAQQYCKTLRLGGYADWRLPGPDEQETAVVFELMRPRHSRDVYAHFDLYWSSDPTVLLPFNYRPAHGSQVSRAYPAKGDDRAFVRAVRSLGSAKSGCDS